MMTMVGPPATLPGTAQTRDERLPPRRDAEADRGRGDPVRRGPVWQATSDRAQPHAIAFIGLALLTGDSAADTFR
jgi:hypothetical protein